VQITHLGHACLLIETPAVRILIDPGVFSDSWHSITEIDAVLVTHQHPDHIDPAHAPALVAANPAALWYVEPSVAALVPPAARASAFGAGDSAAIGDVAVRGVGGRHAVIHPDIPVIGNVGMVLRGPGAVLFRPGDSYSAVPDGIDVLALPLTLLDRPDIRGDRAIDLFQLLEFSRLLPVFRGVGHAFEAYSSYRTGALPWGAPRATRPPLRRRLPTRLDHPAG